MYFFCECLTDFYYSFCIIQCNDEKLGTEQVSHLDAISKYLYERISCQNVILTNDAQNAS